jgi:hypothetical protein
MVLTGRHLLQVIAVWTSTRDTLQERLASDPQADRAWLWRIRLSVCSFLLSRYAEGPRSTPAPPEPRVPPQEVPTRSTDPPASPAPVRWSPPSDQLARLGHYREHCHDTLDRLRPSVEDARAESLRLGLLVVESIARRQARAARRGRRVKRLLKLLVGLALVVYATVELSALIRPGSASTPAYALLRAIGGAGLGLALLLRSRRAHAPDPRCGKDPA